MAPVLSLLEAARHPHNIARGTYLVDDQGMVEPAPAPRFSATPTARPTPSRTIGTDTDQVLTEAGYDAARIAVLRARNTVR